MCISTMLERKIKKNSGPVLVLVFLTYTTKKLLINGKLYLETFLQLFPLSTSISIFLD